MDFLLDHKDKIFETIYDAYKEGLPQNDILEAVNDAIREVERERSNQK